MFTKRFVLVALVLMVLSGLLVYANALTGRFLWDDDTLVRDDVYIRNGPGAFKFFEENIFAGAGKKGHFYRPLQMLTYALDYSFWKTDPAGYHLTNILLHILVGLSVFWLTGLLFGDPRISLLTALFFVVHPVQAEAVSYISGRADPLAALFMLVSFIFYVKYHRSGRGGLYLLTLLSYVLALLSKEAGLILPVLFLLYHYVFKVKIKPQAFLPLVGVSFLYVLWRATVLKSALVPKEPITSTFLERLPGFFAALTGYARLLIWPFGLHMEYGYKNFSFAEPVVLIGMALFFLWGILALRQRKSNRLVFFSLCWFFIALFPVADLYPVNAYMAEHWLYLPSIGFFLLLSRVLSLPRSKNVKVPTAALVAGLFVFYSYLTVRQNAYWQEPIAFYKRTLTYSPWSWKVYYNLGKAYKDSGRNEEAVASYKKAIEIDPKYDEAYYNLGNIYKDAGENEAALAAYTKVIELNPGHINAYNNLSIVYIAMGRNEEAVALLKKAIALRPDFAKAYYNLAVLYFRQAKYDLAVTSCDQAVALGYSVKPEFLKSLEPYRKTLSR